MNANKCTQSMTSHSIVYNMKHCSILKFKLTGPESALTLKNNKKIEEKKTP